MRHSDRTHRHLAALLCLLTFCAAPALGETFTGRIVGVSDGDTLTVLQEGATRRTERIRLHGIDAPEKAQAYGSRSKQALSALAFGKAATVDVRDTDRYGRLVAVVTVAGRNLNREQVKAGMAWWYRKYAPQDRDLQALEADARKARRGLWADKGPVPPWEFRRTPSTRTAPAAADRAEVLYVTPSGRRYHRASCRTLRAVRTPLSRADAEARVYTPCKVCSP